MRTLAIDIETYSPVDISKSGVYAYASHPEFKILLMAYSEDGRPVQIVDFTNGERLPRHVLEALQDSMVLKTAYNANFERVCLSHKYCTNTYFDPKAWECTMIKAAMFGLPMGLDAVSKALRLKENKDPEGKALIRYFTVPCKPTKSNGMRTQNMPEDDPEKWERFKSYCIQDVVVEQAIRDELSMFDIGGKETTLYAIDQRINDTGVLIDADFVDKAVNIGAAYAQKLQEEARNLTGLDNPNSVKQLSEWLRGETDEDFDSLNKESLNKLLKSGVAADCERVLRIRQELSLTSIKKYNAMQDAVCRDNRVRGLLQFYGANRTGRWAGRLIQVQNLRKNSLSDLDLARSVVASGDLDLLELLYGNVPDVLSQLIRTAFIAPEGHTLVVSDFSAIEARVIAWLAGEAWRLEVFATHGKIYEASASQMFKIPLAQITKDSPYRQKGKVAELALGYQGGPNALIKMGALKMSLAESELQDIVNKWRNANPAIVSLWSDVEDAAIEALEYGVPTKARGLKFEVIGRILFIQLPSGRRLSYYRPTLKPGKFGKSLCYEGMDQTTRKWTLQDTYGGKLVENIVQGIARDCLADTLVQLAGQFKVVMHVHDEVVVEAPVGTDALSRIKKIMSRPLTWAPGLLLTADAYETLYYKKD